MKKIITYLAVLGVCCSAFSYAAVQGDRFMQSEEAVQQAVYGHIDAKGLQALLEAQVPLVLLDARGPNWHDNNVIPGAKLAFYTDSAEELAALVPNPESLVVVYCFSFSCPLSPRLAQKLAELGYKNVVEYPAGLKEWRDVAHYPVENIAAETRS